MIAIENLTLYYPDGHCALHEFSCRIAKGEKVALLGANGAGKSSLLHALVGVLPAAAGSIRIGELVLARNNLKMLRRQVGMVFQNSDDQLFSARVADDVAFGPRNLSWDSDRINEKVEQALNEMEISHLQDRSPRRLSDGEKRRAAIAGVLAMAPEVILFDEPSSQLDPRARRNLGQMLGRLPQTMVIATHDLAFAESCCSRAIVLKSGRLAASGPIREILSDSQLLFHCSLS